MYTHLLKSYLYTSGSQTHPEDYMARCIKQGICKTT